jgi:benzoate membrane transport protein
MALSIAMGLCGMLLSLKLRMPVSVAWSTPGGALLASSGAVPGGFSGAVGAFLVTGLLIVLCGLWRPLGRLVAAIPPVLANAMLAGVLLELCLAPVHAVAQVPHLALPVIIVWAVVARIDRRFAVPAAVLVAGGLLAASGTVTGGGAHGLWLTPVLVAPRFSLAGVVGISLPLFIVTMASQNIPGMAVLNVNGYRPAPGGLFTATGLFSLLAAPFGGHAVNLAALTAALCAGPDANADPARRYWAAVAAGGFYVVFGLLAGGAMAMISAAPPVLIEAVAGLALLGALGSALMAAVSVAHEREAAVMTFLVTASGLSFFGISGAFWGLLVGGGLLLADRRRS